MNLIKKKIKKIINKYNNILIGYSGGIDSTILLYNINKYKINNNIRAIHINHNIHKDSLIWQNHCKLFCKQLKIPLIIKNIYIKNINNLENKLRKKRLKIYFKNIKKNEILLLAHHLNDKIETIFLMLKRGTGLKGLIGIKETTIFNKKFIIKRPFININKKYIINNAIKYNIKWIEDNSNLNLKLDRNFLRHKILPLIVKRWKYFYSSLNRNSKICHNQYKLINKLIKKKINLYIKNKYLNLNNIYKLQNEEIIIILRKFIKINNQNYISYKLIYLILKKLKTNKNKNYFQLHLKHFIIIKYKNNLYLEKKFKILKIKTIKWNKNNNTIKLPNDIGVLYTNTDKNKKYINFNRVRKPTKKENIYIKFNIKNKFKIKLLYKKTQKIKNIWQKYKIFPWKRKLTPIIFYNKIPILCPNIFITKKAKPSKNNWWNIILNIKK